ncbi:hypothetical protein DHEL01_v212512 [Diaporthe helianthi]|uniref:Uncharacterized protein n=1 Tax=Diaporthe helianthi TaxID=158607 RepID=A0A2P5HFT0_DIAHE|nr:hypothetical protein DHEL01_v212512 [Diaporthe helianthi]
MRPLALLRTLLHLLELGCSSMAMAIGDPSALEVRNASVADTQSLDDPAPNWGPFCKRGTTFLTFYWNVRLPGPYKIPLDIKDMCHELWRGLSNHGGCIVSGPDCGPAGLNATVLHLYFHTSYFCTLKNVEDAIAAATRGSEGNVHCEHE